MTKKPKKQTEDAFSFSLSNQLLRTENARLIEMLDASDEENLQLENELRHMRERHSRIQDHMDRLEALMAQRTSALCALIELPDPR